MMKKAMYLKLVLCFSVIVLVIACGGKKVPQPVPELTAAQKQKLKVLQPVPELTSAQKEKLKDIENLNYSVQKISNMSGTADKQKAREAIVDFLLSIDFDAIIDNLCHMGAVLADEAQKVNCEAAEASCIRNTPKGSIKKGLENQRQNLGTELNEFIPKEFAYCMGKSIKLINIMSTLPCGATENDSKRVEEQGKSLFSGDTKKAFNCMKMINFVK